MSAGDRDTLAALLRKHPLILGRCHCGYGLQWSHGIDESLHRAHVADVLLASDWLREQRTEAWDAGYRSGASNVRRQWSDEPHLENTPNPYRTTEDTDAH